LGSRCLSLSEQTCDSLKLSWNVVTGASLYNVFRNGSQVGTSPSTSFTDTGLTKNTIYSYTLEACNSCGCSSQSSANTGTTTDVPGQPQAPLFSGQTCNSLVVSWTAVLGASSYKIYRDSSFVGNSSTTSYTDTSLSPSTSYTYTIEACNSCGCSSQGPSASGSTTGIPGNPSSPSFSGQTCSSITLTWSIVPGATSYQVYRAGTQIDTTTLTSYTNTGLAKGTSYCYSLIACNSCGCSNQGSQACTSTTDIPGIPGAPSSSTQSCTSISLTWSPVAGADSYQVFRNGSQVGAPSSNSYTDTGLTMGASYSYSLKACNTCGCSSTGSSASYSTGNIPGTPGTPSVGFPGCSSLVISWSSVSGASYYKVYRSGTYITNSSTTSLTDTGLSPGTSYSYVIEACNTCGCSGQSNSASGRTNDPGCSSNSQCVDTTVCTQDICNNPGTCSSYCSNPPEPTTVQCLPDTSCSYTGCASYCTRQGTYIDYHCNGSGACQGYTTNCGTSSCSGGTKCSSGSCVSASETCNGTDDDCDALIDEGYEDGYEENDSVSQEKNLGTFSDCNNFPYWYIWANILPAHSEEDWFYTWVSDDLLCSLNPHVRIDNLPADYDLKVYYECAGGNAVTSVTCNMGSYCTNGSYKGCCSSNSGTTADEVELAVDCSGTSDESGGVHTLLF